MILTHPENDKKIETWTIRGWKNPMDADSRCVKELFGRRELAMALIPSLRRFLPVKLVNGSSAETEVDHKKRKERDQTQDKSKYCSEEGIQRWPWLLQGRYDRKPTWRKTNRNRRGSEYRKEGDERRQKEKRKWLMKSLTQDESKYNSQEEH
jgi:hypothetical protein